MMKKYLIVLVAFLAVNFLVSCRKVSPIIPVDSPCAPCQNKVVFQDKNLEAAIRQSLNNTGCDICEADLKLVTSIYISAQVNNFSGIEKLANLKVVIITNSTIPDFTFLNGLTGVYYINASNCPVGSLAGLDSDANPVTVTVTELNLGNCGLSDISGLSKLTNMQQLFLNNNQIGSLAVLSNMTKLRTLNVGGNTVHLTSLSPIEAISSLQILLAGDNSISITATDDLSALTALQQLDLSSNNVGDISKLSALTGLQQLSLSSNNISDINALSGLLGLTELDLSNNHISDISALSGLILISNLNLSSNNIADITALSGLKALNVLKLSSNNLSDISALVANSGIGSGDFIYLDGNPALSNPGPEADIAALEARNAVVVH